MLRMSDTDVVEYMDKYDLPKHPLQSQGYHTVGDWHSSRAVQPGEDARSTRFGGKFEECGLHVETHEPVKGAAASTSTAPSPSANAPSDSTSPSADANVPLPVGLEALGFVRSHQDTELAVIMVKKKMEDGGWCRKCNDVVNKMAEDKVDGWVPLLLVSSRLAQTGNEW